MDTQRRRTPDAETALAAAIRAHCELLDAEERFDEAMWAGAARRRPSTRARRGGSDVKESGQPPLQGVRFTGP